MKFLSICILFVLSSAHALSDPTFEDISQLITSKNIKSVDSLLPLLPKEYRSEFTLMYRSDSIQHASPLNPRAIIFGKTAQTLISFTCESGNCVGGSDIEEGKKITKGPGKGMIQAGFGRLEVIQWRNDSKSFEFREISFPKTEDGKVQISEPNPAQCLKCHGVSDPRPIWAPYRNWPGAYGGRNDFSGPGVPRYLDDESAESLKEFINSAPERKNYRHLVDLKSGYEFNPSTYFSSKMRNHDFTLRLHYLNFARLARKMKSMPYWDTIKYLVYAIPQCGFDGPISDDQSRWKRLSKFFPSETLPSELNSCALPPLNGPEEYVYSDESLAALIYNSAGVDTSQWFMNFTPGIYNSFTTPLAGSSAFIYSIGSADPELSQMSKFYFSNYTKIWQGSVNSCDDLIAKSKVALASADSNELKFLKCFTPKDDVTYIKPEDFSPQKVVQTCIQCHSGNSPVGPTIPFTDLKKLSFEMKQKISVSLGDASESAIGVSQMPLGLPKLTPDQRRLFMDWLSQ